MLTTVVHAVINAVWILIFSLFGLSLWIYLPVATCITLTIHLLIMHSYFKGIMGILIKKHPQLFNDQEENDIILTTPGVFLPQIASITPLAAIDYSASIVWVQILSLVEVVLGIVFGKYILVGLGAIVFIAYLFTHIGGMFYHNNAEADMFSSTRRYLSKTNRDVKKMDDFELYEYSIKYQRIVDKLVMLQTELDIPRI